MPMKLQDQHLKGLNSRKHPLTKQPQLSQSHILPFQKDAKPGQQSPIIRHLGCILFVTVMSRIAVVILA